MSSSTTNDTSASLLRLVGRKHKAKLGADLNESVATGPSAFARAQLEKLGWKEGTGLGKNRDGRSDHIRVTKRAEGQAIGAASVEIDPVVTGDQWWKSSVGNTLARLAAAKKNKKSKKKDKKKKDKKEKPEKKRKLEYTDEELFEATGGARFGMRAQTQQRGKWNRAEDAITKDQEETAKSKTEWDGMAAPKVVLSSKSKKEKKVTDTAKIEEESSSSSASSSKPPKRKKRKLSSEDDENAKNEANTEKEKSKKEKKSKKSKKDKKKKKEKN